MSMRNETITAMAKAAPSANSKAGKVIRDSLTVGNHEVDAVVRLTGTLTVGEDEMAKSTSSILNIEFLLMTLRAAGVTREAAAKAINEISSDYLDNWTGSKEDKKTAAKARKEALAKYDPEGKAISAFKDMVAQLPLTPKRGKVTFKGEAVELEVPVITEKEAAAKAEAG